jgi:hypothetical protein
VVRSAADVVLEGCRDARPEGLDHVEDAESRRHPRGAAGERRTAKIAGMAAGTGHIRLKRSRACSRFFLMICSVLAQPVLPAGDREGR